MVREIKFRVYDPDNGGMCECKYIKLPSEITEESQAILPIMQYTGLHDKNGKEIYEGDILKARYGVINEVRYGEFAPHMINEFCESIGLKPSNIIGFYTVIHEPYEICVLPKVAERVVEVIGNIYENPELLEV